MLLFSYIIYVYVFICYILIDVIMKMLYILIGIIALLIPDAYGGEDGRVFKITDNTIVATPTNTECEVIEMDDIGNEMMIVANCPQDVANKYGFEDDLIVRALDEDINTHTGGSILHFANNLGGGRIAIIDSGINYNHPELASSYVGGYDFVNNDNDPMDDNGHGTFVAGIISANGKNPNAKGIAPNTEIIAMKVLNDTGAGFLSDVIDAIYYTIDGPDRIYGTADDFNVDVINLSLGSLPPYTFQSFCDEVYPDFTNAIEYARSKGVIVVSAAGNFGKAGVSIPGCISSSLTVGAININDNPAFFTSIGEAVDISTIGVNVFSTTIHGYNIKSGTSFSTPAVSGALTLLKRAYPSYTIDEIENRLLNTTADIYAPGKDNRTGYGKLDIYEATRDLQLILSDSTIPTNKSIHITCFEEPAHPAGNKGNIIITTPIDSYGGAIKQFVNTDYDMDGINDVIFDVSTNEPYFGLDVLNATNYIVECNTWNNSDNNIHSIMRAFYVSFFVLSESAISIIFLIAVSLLITSIYMYKRKLIN